MTRQARRTGATTKRAGQAGPAELTDTTAVPQAELLDDRTMAIGGDAAASRGRGLGFARSLPGALVGTFLIAGLAFGAAVGPNGLLGAGGSKGDLDAKDGTTAYQSGDGWVEKTPAPADKVVTVPTDKPEPVADATEKPVSDATAKPESEATPKPEPEKTPKPTPKPEPKPEPKPQPETIGIWVQLVEGYPVVGWDACGGDFDYYKVVRSKDSTVSWPTGDNDEVIGVVEPGGKRKAWDKHSPDGRKLWYRVFCVRRTDNGYKVIGSSNAKGIEVPNRPDPTPPPDPIGLALEASLTAEGKVELGWSACNVDGFVYYKLVRANHDNPSYFPWTDGTTLLAAIGEVNSVGWLDKPAAGQTVYYRVQCLGHFGDSKVLLGQSDVVAVTVP